MATARFAWGIDVGNRALKAVKLIRDGDQLRVDDFELIEHETVLSNAGDNRESLIQTALASFLQRHPTKGGAVSVGVSGQSSFARFIKLPPVEDKRIPEIVRFEAIQQIPFPLDDVEWSYQLFRTADSPDVEVGIFAMRKELVNQHIKYFTDIDLNVQVVQMNPLAVYNALQRDGKFEGGTTMVIDLGAENTDLLIADNETIWMRSIPIGGNNFTETLVKAFKLNFAKAEDLKRNAATSKYARQIFQAMRPIFADLVAEIQRSVGFYASVHRDSRIKKVIALGGTFRLPGLQKYLQQNLQMDVERLDHIGANPPSDPKLVPTFNENLLSVVSAYGLALQAMDEAKVTSSLLPAHIRREKMWKEKTKWFGAAAALFCVGTGLAAAKYLLNDFQFNSSQNHFVQQIESVKSEATRLDQSWETLANAGKEEKDAIQNIRKLDSYRTLWRNLLIDLYGALPTDQRTEAATQPSELKKVPRAERKFIVIDKVTSRFFPDLGTRVLEPNFDRYAVLDNTTAAPVAIMDPAMAAAMGGTPAPAPEISPGQGNGVVTAASHGFVIVLQCTSPYGQAIDPQGLVDKEFIGKLLDIKPSAARPKMEYAVARVVLGRVNKIKADPTRLQQIRAEWDMAYRLTQAAAAPGGGAGAGLTGYPGAGYPGGRFGVPPGMPPGMAGGYEPGYMGGPIGRPADPNVADAEAYKDPLTEEDLRDDWEFEVVIGVVIDPPPYTAPAAAPQASAQ